MLYNPAISLQLFISIVYILYTLRNFYFIEIAF